MEIKEYIISLYQIVPDALYKGLLSLLIQRPFVEHDLEGILEMSDVGIKPRRYLGIEIV